MEENAKIKLNLSGLQKKNGDTKEAEDIGFESKIVARKKEHRNIKLELTQNISTPYRVMIAERILHDTGVHEAGKSDIVQTEQVKDSEVLGGNMLEKLSFAAITGMTQEQEKENSKNKMDAEQERDATQSAKDKIREENRIEQKKEEVKFANYKSAFKNESENLIKKIQKFRYAPKTRVGFLATLIVLTAFSIGLLMVFFPEKHSPEIYKASLLEIYNSERKNYSETEAIQDSWEDENDELGNEEIPIENAEEIGDDTEEVIEEETEISEMEREMIRVRNHLLDRYK